jgi:hypothetical protein
LKRNTDEKAALLSGRLGKMANSRNRWSQEILEAIWEYKKKARCSWPDLCAWIKAEYGLNAAPDYLSRMLRIRLGLTKEDLSGTRGSMKKKAIVDMTIEELYERGIEPSAEMIMKAKVKPVWCSDVRWRIELKRRERKEYYDSLPPGVV